MLEFTQHVSVVMFIEWTVYVSNQKSPILLRLFLWTHHSHGIDYYLYPYQQVFKEMVGPEDIILVLSHHLQHHFF